MRIARPVAAALACTMYFVPCFTAEWARAAVSATETLWYDAPAKRWEEALPIGNGRLGGMIHGGIDSERIELNDNTLYSGEPGRRDLPLDVTRDFDKVVGWLRSGQYAEAQSFVTRNWLGRPQECYQPLGDLHLAFDAQGGISGYRRELDISRGVASTRYVRGDVEWTREHFASHPDRAMVLRIRTGKAGATSFAAQLASVHPAAKCSIEGGNTLVMRGQAPGLAVRRDLKWIASRGEQWKYPELFGKDGQPLPGAKVVQYGAEIGGRGMFFEIRLRVIPEGGHLVAGPDHLKLDGANAATLILTSGTSYNGFDKSPSREGADPAAQARAALDAAAAKSYSALLQTHVRDYQQLYQRVALELGRPGEQSELTTDQRVLKYAAGGDEALVSLFFQYGRYLMISGSRPGGQPLNLQGIWNPQVIPPWASAYTTNINAEMNYWPAEVTNLSECHEPLLRMVSELSVTGRKVAAEVYRRPGWVLHHNTTIWRDTQPVDGDARAAFWPLGAGWMCQHLWEHYAFTGDERFLREQAYPVMRGAAEFLAAWLVDDGAGRLVTPVGGSPENAFRYIDPATGQRKSASLCMGPAMDMAIIRELFTHCILASERLKVDESFRQVLAEKRAKLLPYQVGKRGQLMEWSKDFEEAEPRHRHLSHLYGLHPGNQITRQGTPDLYAAARRSLELRGDEATGWSMGWKINFWARMEDGDHAHLLLRNLLRLAGGSGPGASRGGGVYANLFDAHPPFQIDGNFGATAGIAEMLLQSHAGEIHLLPALPSAWPAGSVRGLRARGGYEVEIAWADGRMIRAVIRSTLGGPCTLRCKDRTLRLDTSPGAAYEWDGVAGATRRAKP